eukprot:4300895-Alexandrium_andersonii.AAC.1
MSASLVGSEMCIRDSQWTLEALSACSGWAPGLVPHESWGNWAKPWESPCLLYTSDAADDM